TMGKARGFQHLAGRDQIGGVETELRVLTTAGRPFAGTFAVQADANPDHRLDADFFRGFDRLFELLEFFNDDDNELAKFPAEQCDSNKRLVLVAVADDQTLGVLVHRERGDQFRFAARFQSEMELLASIDNLFDDFAELIDLNRKDTAILTPITEFGDRILKCEVD